MVPYRCKNCIWWDATHPRLETIPAFPGITRPGICRKHKPGGVNVGGFIFGVQTIMDAEDLCGEAREEKE